MKWPAESVSETSPSGQEESFDTVSVSSPDDAQRVDTDDLPLSLCRAIGSLEEHIKHTQMPFIISKVTYPRGDTFYERCNTLNIKQKKPYLESIDTSL